MTTPAVTVLMPVYNGGPFLRPAIDSVLGQTFGDFELLVIDDASTDDSCEAVRAAADPRVRLVRNERNLGQTRTLNRGLELARGRYVARLDQDDVSLPRRLERQVATLEARPDLTVVGTWGYYMDATGRRRIGATRRRVLDRGDFLGGLALGECPLWHISVTFRRDAIRDLGGYDPAFGPAEDYELWTRVGRTGGRAIVLPEFHCVYRLHGMQQSVTSATAQRRSIVRAHEAFLDGLCTPARLPDVGRLLRIEDGFWTACPTRAERAEVVREARGAFENLARRHALSAEERRSLRSTVRRRVGLGLAMGTVLRRGPAPLAYAAFFALSPMLIPHARRTVAPFVRGMRWLPYRRRLPWATAGTKETR
jgi:GT2 family glycosyltransferase